MSYCLNPICQQPQNFNEARFCDCCGERLWLQGRYQALKPIGQGSFGRIFLAVDEIVRTKPRCVIKQFAPEDPETKEIAQQLFQHEAYQLSRLGKHSQIPKLISYLEIDQCQYIVQEFIDGQDLEQEFQVRPFNQYEIIELLHNLLPVVQFIHSHGVIHRDIKPENIIRSSFLNPALKDFDLILIDFGAAKGAFTVSSRVSSKGAGTNIGTPHYSAPEQAAGQATFASDIYGLATTCIYLLTGESPNFKLYSHADSKWIWQDYVGDRTLDRQFCKILDKMLARDLKHRYQSVAEILRDLKLLGNLDKSVAIPKLPHQPKFKQDIGEGFFV